MTKYFDKIHEILLETGFLSILEFFSFVVHKNIARDPPEIQKPVQKF